jgi:hypothetical protein
MSIIFKIYSFIFSFIVVLGGGTLQHFTSSYNVSNILEFTPSTILLHPTPPPISGIGTGMIFAFTKF